MQSYEFPKSEDFGFWKNLFLTAFFFTIAPLALGISLFSLLSLNDISKQQALAPELSALESPKSGIRVYASLPNSFPMVSEEVGSSDARAEIIGQYLTNYGSILEPYASLIVDTSDKYSLDFRLITAIAQQESNLCKLMPQKSYNCWGWGIHSEGSLGFTSFEQGIEEVSKGLKEEYIDRGYQTIDEIMTKYTPLSNGSWALGVNQFMIEME